MPQSVLTYLVTGSYSFSLEEQTFTKSKFLLFITDDLNKTIQFYHPNPTTTTTTTTKTTTTTNHTDQSIDLFSAIPLANSQPPWNPQDHSSPPSDFFEPSLKNHPLPTNAWWQNLGNFLSSPKDQLIWRCFLGIFNSSEKRT